MATDHSNRDHTLRLAPIEPEEYDALADLFLGASPLAPERAEAGEQPEVALVVTDELYDDESLIELPEPPEAMRRVPMPIAEPVVESIFEAEPAPRVMPPVQVLAKIIPDEKPQSDERVVPVEPASIPRPGVEVVLLGHLPVRATLWVRQYACAVARETGETVALIRAASGSTAVDLITGDRPVETKPAVSIAHALEKAAHLAGRVIVRVDESNEPELLEHETVDRVTILTGADETAVVASYRLIKALTASWDWGDDHAPDLRMAVMGGTSEQSADARAKLTRAVESFLDHPIEIVISAGRIDATGTMNLFRDDVAHPVAHILDGLVERCRVACEEQSVIEHPVMPEGLTATRSPIDVLREDVDALEALEALSSRARSVPRERSEAIEEDPEIKKTGSTPALIPQKRTLGGLVTGLRVLETRCPSAPGVELAADESGRVHLVTDDAHPEALTRLLSAQAWARDHLQLLLRAEESLAMPSADPAADTDPTLHLLSSEPRALMAVYPTAVRVYALARVEVGGHIARVATPIN